MALHIDQLPAQESDSPYVPWVGTPEFVHDFQGVQLLLVELLREWEQFEAQKEAIEGGDSIENGSNKETPIRASLQHAEDVLSRIVQACVASMLKNAGKNAPRVEDFVLRRLSRFDVPDEPCFEDDD